MLTTEEIKRFIDEDRTSFKKKKAREGLRYYEGEHDILQSRLFFINKDGKAEEDKTKSNIRVCHPFFTEQVDQKTQYYLSGEGSFVTSKIPELQAHLDEYFDDEFKAELSDVITYGSAEGFSYFYGHKNEDNKTRFVFAEGLTVVDVPAKYASDKQDHTIYYYVDKVEKDKVTSSVEVWDAESIYFYTLVDETLTKDESKQYNPRPHILFEPDEDGSREYDSYGFVPFWRFDNNKKQISDLKPVKDIIDDYDRHACGISNNLEDLTDGYFIVKGFDGDNIQELVQNLKVKRAVGVGAQGDVDIKTVNIPYEARSAKMALDVIDIYRAGMALNSSQVGDGNVTNVVIKSRYALLDMKCNKLDKNVKKLMKQLVKVVLKEINDENGTDYTLRDVKIEFKREIITNESDSASIELTKAQRKQTEINTLLSIAEKLDNDTIIKGICEILDIDYEEIKSKIPKEDSGVGINEASEKLATVDEE